MASFPTSFQTLSPLCGLDQFDGDSDPHQHRCKCDRVARFREPEPHRKHQVQRGHNDDEHEKPSLGRYFGEIGEAMPGNDGRHYDDSQRVRQLKPIQASNSVNCTFGSMPSPPVSDIAARTCGLVGIMGPPSGVDKCVEELGSKATFDDIANRAGLSRRTLFRYVDTKEALLFIHPILWLEIFDEAVLEVADKSLRDRTMYAARKISEHIDADPEPVRRAMLVALADPAMARGHADVTRRWVARIAAEVQGDATDAETAFRARVLGAAVMAVIDAALNEWFTTEPQPPLVDLVERGLDYLAPLL